jgi:hypothetical protein
MNGWQMKKGIKKQAWPGLLLAVVSPARLKVKMVINRKSYHE